MAKNPIPPEADRICTACPSLFQILINLLLLYKTAALPHRIILPQPNALPFNRKDLQMSRQTEPNPKLHNESPLTSRLTYRHFGEGIGY